MKKTPQKDDPKKTYKSVAKQTQIYQTKPCLLQLKPNLQNQTKPTQTYQPNLPNQTN